MTQPQYPQQNGQQNAPSAYTAPAFQEPQIDGNRISLSQPLYGASPTQAFVRFFKKYATFSGRASRSEFWWMQMWIAVIYIGVYILAAIFAQSNSTTAISGILFFLLALFSLAVIVPSWAITVRRYHDSNHSGLLYLMTIILQIIGGVVAFIGIISVFGSIANIFATYGSLGYNDTGFDSTGDYFGESTSFAAAYSYSSTGYENEAAAAMFSAIMKVMGWLIVGGLISFAGQLTNFIFTLLGSKVEGARFDSPRLPDQYTVQSPNAQAAVFTATQVQQASQFPAATTYQQPVQQSAPVQNEYGAPAAAASPEAPSAPTVPTVPATPAVPTAPTSPATPTSPAVPTNPANPADGTDASTAENSPSSDTSSSELSDSDSGQGFQQNS